MPATGYFGEGVKVEVNRLVAAGASVEYRTANVLWTFEYLRAKGCETEELHIVSRRQFGGVDGNTTMTISTPAQDGKLHASLDFKKYLFFQDSYRAFTWPLNPRSKPDDIAGLEILPDSQHHGCIFAHGMPVCVDRKLKGFGLDYLGMRQKSL